MFYAPSRCWRSPTFLQSSTSQLTPWESSQKQTSRHTPHPLRAEYPAVLYLWACKALAKQTNHADNLYGSAKLVETETQMHKHKTTTWRVRITSQSHGMGSDWHSTAVSFGFDLVSELNEGWAGTRHDPEWCGSHRWVWSHPRLFSVHGSCQLPGARRTVSNLQQNTFCLLAGLGVRPKTDDPPACFGLTCLYFLT